MIAITGATGVLGGILKRELTAAGQPFTSFCGDLRARQEIRQWIAESRPTMTFHLAAKVPVDLVEREPALALDVNAGGTISLLTELTAQCPRSWVFIASTAHVYKSSDLPLSETDTLEPQTIYGHSKLIAEEAADYFAKHTNLAICVGRIFSFYHESQKPPFLYPTIMMRLQNHDPAQEFRLTNGDDIRDITRADQIIADMMLLGRRSVSGTVNIATGHATRIADFVQQLAGPRVRIRVDQERPPRRLVANISRLNASLCRTAKE